MKKILVGMETSGTIRQKFRDAGFDAWSIDLLPSLDNSPYHVVANVFDFLDSDKTVWDLAIFHPSCTYLTCSAEWAYKEPDYLRYPDVGYHQRVNKDTLVGSKRFDARLNAFDDFVECLNTSNSYRIAVENPIGIVSSWLRKPDQIIQPYQFGENASKATCLWLNNLPKLVPTNRFTGRFVIDKSSGKKVERWSNQTDSGQNKLSPSKDRWAERSKTYAGIAKAMVDQWGHIVRNS